MWLDKFNEGLMWPFLQVGKIINFIIDHWIVIGIIVVIILILYNWYLRSHPNPV